MSKSLDMSSFSCDDFNPKDWINNAYAASNKNENKETFVSNTISTLHLYIQQLDHALEETTAQVISGLPRLAREANSAEVGARGLQARMSLLQGVIEDAQKAAGQPLHTLQKTDRLKAKLETARQSLMEADKWAGLANNLETILESGDTVDLPTITDLLEKMNQCLDALSGSSDYEDKRLHLEGLRNRFEALLSPIVVEAFSGRQTDRCRQLWQAFGAMTRLQALSVYRARCELATLKSTVVTGSSRSPANLRDMHAALLRHTIQQLEWLPQACPGDATLPWLLKLHSSILQDEGAQYASLGGAVVESPEELEQLLQACDHYALEINNIIKKEQKKHGIVSENELKELGSAIYSPVRSALSTMGTLLVASMAEDLGPMPTIDNTTSEAGTTFQLRISRGSNIINTRLNQGRTLSRGTTPSQLKFAAQWLIKELSLGWNEVKELPACLSLLKACVGLKQLPEQVDQYLEYDVQDDPVTAKFIEVPAPFKDWPKLLQTKPSPQCSPTKEPFDAPVKSLYNVLWAMALNKLLEPVSTYIDGVDSLSGWTGNEQYEADLPDFSLSPQEYITEIGQYLLSLPQHLEPLLVHGMIMSSDEDQAYCILNQVCNSACEMLATKISSIKEIDSLGARKCSTDIAYLTSVLEELGAGTNGLLTLGNSLNMKNITVE